jgi:hypothetical protein
VALEGDADVISLPDAVEHSIRAAWPVYELYGAKDRLGIHYSHHAHAFTAEDWTAIMDFADKTLRAMPANTTFSTFLTQEQRTAAIASSRTHSQPASATPPTGVPQ